MPALEPVTIAALPRSIDEFIARSDLPAVLGLHGYDRHEFLREEDFPLFSCLSSGRCVFGSYDGLSDAHLAGRRNL